MSVTVMPRSAARNAAAYPPGPPPTTAMFMVSDIKALTTEGTERHRVTRVQVFPLCFSVSPVFHDLDFDLSLYRQQEWLLKRLRNPAQEAGGVGAVDQAMVVGERERQDEARL